MFNCNCKWTEIIAGLVILVFTMWPTLVFSAMVSKWLVVISAVVLLLHGLLHHKCSCGMCMKEEMPKNKKRKR